jgi:hypothetical protein
MFTEAIRLIVLFMTRFMHLVNHEVMNNILEVDTQNEFPRMTYRL